MKFSSTARLALCALLLTATAPLSGCGKIKALISKKPGAPDAPAGSSPTPAGAASAPSTAGKPVAAASPGITVTGPTPVPTPAKPAVDKTSSVMVLCYHNIEDGGKMKALTISVEEFEKEMQAVKDNGFTVIGMQDFLAWRRGEKNIPHKSCVLTIDDGWVSGYTNAWPILKKYGYPFTVFIYVNYVGTGGKSLSWDQLAEMRDAGVDIQSHTYSHSNLKAPGTGVDKHTKDLVTKDIQTLGLDGWRKKEIQGSKETLEKQLGIKVNALAYPFGNYDNAAREVVKQAGYEAAFTVYGQRLTASAPFDLLGRYAVEGSKPKIFEDAMAMIGGGVSAADASTSSVAQLASASMITEPMDGATINNPSPAIKANLATMGDVDPSTLEVRVSGVGQLAAKYDAPSRMLTAQISQKLAPGTYTVIISGKVNNNRAETRWSFNVAPGGATAPAATTATPPAPAKKP